MVECPELDAEDLIKSKKFEDDLDASSRCSGMNNEEEDVTPKGVNVEMLEEDADVEYDDLDGIETEDMFEHDYEDRMSISLASCNIVDIDSEDEDDIEESRKSKRVLKEKERLKIPRWLKATKDIEEGA